MTTSEKDRDILARTLWGEARGEGFNQRRINPSGEHRNRYSCYCTKSRDWRWVFRDLNK